MHAISASGNPATDRKDRMSTIEYTPATLKRAATILANAHGCIAPGTPIVQSPLYGRIAPEGGVNAEPSILQAPSRKSRAKVAVAKVQHSDAKRAQMSTRKPSIGQMDRINARHEEIGMRPYKTLATFRKCFPTMLDASDYWMEVRA
jgi:hypothetical protein